MKFNQNEIVQNIGDKTTSLLFIEKGQIDVII
jgi:hypothetical protein